MLDQTLVPRQRTRVPAKSIAMPVEHGAWGFLFEPLMVGLLIAPSTAAPFIAIMTIGAFLARQPLKFVLGDFLQDKWLPRSKVAVKFLFIFGLIAAVGFGGTLVTAERQAFIPFVIAAPAVIYLVMQDAARQSREALAEILAALVLSSTISSLALAADMGFLFAALIWLTMVSRLVPSILYIRSRLRLEKGKSYSIALPVAVHVLAIAVISVAYFAGSGSILTIIVAFVLLVRSATGLSRARARLTAKQLGIREVIFGVAFALSVVIGYYTGI